MPPATRRTAPPTPPPRARRACVSCPLPLRRRRNRTAFRAAVGRGAEVVAAAGAAAAQTSPTLTPAGEKPTPGRNAEQGCDRPNRSGEQQISERQRHAVATRTARPFAVRRSACPLEPGKTASRFP